MTSSHAATTPHKLAPSYHYSSTTACLFSEFGTEGDVNNIYTSALNFFFIPCFYFLLSLMSSFSIVLFDDVTVVAL